MATQTSRLALVSRPLGMGSALRTLSAYFALARQRNDLAQLDERMLSDIGLTVDDAQTEAKRAPWDVPTHWRA